MPASSASCARRMLLSQELTQRSGTFVTDMPPEQFGEKKPNFNLLWFRMGDCFRPMRPQSDPVAGFYSMDNLRIMPENSNCSSRADTSRNRRVLHISGGRDLEHCSDCENSSAAVTGQAEAFGPKAGLRRGGLDSARIRTSGHKGAAVWQPRQKVPLTS